MSWTRVLDPYQQFQKAASIALDGRGLPSFASPYGSQQMIHTAIDEARFCPAYLDEKARVCIIFAPLDEVLRDLAPGIVALCEALWIPPEFLTERLQGVCHSFGTRTDEHGFAAWFHYLCKAVEPGFAVRHRWYKSAFFLRKDELGNVTLVIFGPTPGVRARVEQFRHAATAKSCNDIVTDPLVLFDLVFDGMLIDIDTTVWWLVDVILELEFVSSLGNRNIAIEKRCHRETLPSRNADPPEQRLIQAANSRRRRQRTADEIDFAELHSWTKHLISLGEAIDSCLLMVEDCLANVGKKHPVWASVVGATPVGVVPDAHEQVKETLQYRHLLFNSTKLRLTSL